MPSQYTSLENAVADIFSLFDRYIVHDITRLVVYGSALDDIQTANDIDLIVVGPVGESLESELAFHMTMDKVWPESKFGPSDMLVITDEQYQRIREADDPDGQDSLSQHIIDAVREGRTFHRDDFIDTEKTFFDTLVSRLPIY